MSEQVKTRAEAALEDTWATEDIFSTDEAWEQAYAKATQIPAKLASFAGRLANAKDMLAFWQTEDEADIELSAVYRYASLKADEDTTVGKYAEMRGRAYSLYVSASAASSFSSPEIMAIAPEKIEAMYEEEPALVLYRRAIDMILVRREHTLSEAEERLLALAGEMANAPDDISSKLCDADIRFPDVDTPDGKKPLTEGGYAIFRTAPDRDVRKDAFTKLHETYHSFENTFAATLDAQNKQLHFFAGARKYESALEAALTANEVPVSVYHNLIDTVHERMEPMHRYAALRKRLLALDELHMYDLYVPIVADADMRIPFDEAKKTCLEALKPLGEDYCRVIKEGFDNRWIDVYENRGKRSGAYSAGARPHPYVLLNYSGTLDSEFTLIHEMGHSLHSYLSKEKQPTVYSDYVIFVAEVASTCNEVLLMRHLLSKTDDKRTRAYLINYFLEQFRTTLYRQTMFAEFERKISSLVESGTTLTAELLDDIYYKLNCEYYGPAVCVDREISYEWARIPHFYYNFYVFQYSTGFCAAVALASKILSGDPAAAENYLGFLSGGCSADPITLLRGAGVDMASPEPVNEAIDLFSSLVDELDELLK